MKVTVVANEVGEVVASMRAQESDRAATPEPTSQSSEPVGFPTLIPNPGQTIHELTVPDDLGRLGAADFHARLTDHLPADARKRARD